MRENRRLGRPGESYFRLLDEGYAKYHFDVNVLDNGLIASIGKKAGEAYLNAYMNVQDAE